MEKIMSYYRLLIIFVLIIFTINCHSELSQPKVKSPNGRLQVELTISEGHLLYTVTRDNKILFQPSRLGLIFKKQEGFADHLTIDGQSLNRFDETWEQPWGEEKFIRNHYNELTVEISSDLNPDANMSVLFRVYDDGFAFRYSVSGNGDREEFIMLDELSEFAIASDPESWWIKAYQWNRYEYLYEQSLLSEIDTVHTPVTMKVNPNLYLSIHEAALTDYASMTIEQTGGNTLKCNLVPWADGTKVKGKFPLLSPWRTVQINDTAGGLISSYLILNCNEPNKLTDVSWIKPGKYIGIWWGMHLGTMTWYEGDIHGATTDNSKEYINYAAEFGFDGVLIEGWNKGWNSDWFKDGNVFSFTESFKDFDLDAITEYGKQKDIKVIGHHETSAAIGNYEDQVDAAFKLYQEHGIETIKTGYVGHGTDIVPVGGKPGDHEWHHGQYMVNHYRDIVKKAAEYKIMLDVHEPIKATGIRRTYPNMMTREGARGQEYNAWSGDGGNPPDHTTILPFTRLLGGPMDFTPGIIDLTFDHANRIDNRVNTTLAKQLALYVVLYSPLQMAADLPENYKDEPAFQFIKDVPVDWETTLVPHGEIGDYVVIVRKDRNSDDWYIAGITDENERDLTIELFFLDKNKQYTATIYSDGEDAHWEDNPYSLDIKNMMLKRMDKLTLRLAAGGGQAIRITPEIQ
jgi:alpha-glucosidase